MLRSPGLSPSPKPGDWTPRDFSFLLRPEIYHTLSSINIPVSFRNSSHQPSADVPIEELVAKGFFRAAAIRAAQELTSSSPTAEPIKSTDHKRIFSLLYIRLSCLTLIDATSLAAQEAKALEDMSSIAVYGSETKGNNLIPWDLRVLSVRLQAIAFGDTRRSVMGFYDLAREARDRVARAAAEKDNSARELWKARLADLGLKVSGALVEMDDLAGAAHHLATLKDRGDGKVSIAMALLLLQIGDVDAARAVVLDGDEEGGRETGEKSEIVILALADMADGSFEGALRKWKELKDRDEEVDEMVWINTAVCLLYMSRMDEV